MATARFHTISQLSRTRRMTPEGYMVIEGVPAARAGEMVYAPGELPLPVGSDGVLRVQRSTDALFNETTMASYNGKPVVLGHPDDDVAPHNWSQLAKGIMFSPRRGTGRFADCMLVDIMLTDAEAIKAVNRGQMEVSAGYDADYFETELGRADQRNILANHLALVPRGRCGPRCSIGDRLPSELHDNLETPMSKSLWERIRAAFTANNTDELDALIAEGETATPGGTEDVHVHIHANNPALPARTADCGGAAALLTHDEDSLEARFAAHVESNAKQFDELRAMLTQALGARTIDAAAQEEAAAAAAREAVAHTEQTSAEMAAHLEAEAPTEAKGVAAKAKDSEHLQGAFQDTVSGAELLVPGISIPEFKQEDEPALSFATIDGLRRRTLDLAFNSPATRDRMMALVQDEKFEAKNLTAEQARVMFRAATAMTKDAGRMQLFIDVGHRVAPAAAAKTAPKTQRELNQIYAAHYGLN